MPLISLILRSENDMIKFGGYNIFPMEIERVLQDHLAMRYALSLRASAA